MRTVFVALLCIFLFSCEPEPQYTFPNIHIQKASPAFYVTDRYAETELVLDQVEVSDFLLTDTAIWICTDLDGVLRFQNGKRYWVDKEFRELKTYGYTKIKSDSAGRVWLLNQYNKWVSPLLYFDNGQWYSVRYTHGTEYFMFAKNNELWYSKESYTELIHQNKDQIDTLTLPFKIVYLNEMSYDNNQKMWFTAWIYNKTLFGSLKNRSLAIIRYKDSVIEVLSDKNLFNLLDIKLWYDFKIRVAKNNVWLVNEKHILRLNNDTCTYYYLESINQGYEEKTDIVIDHKHNLWIVASNALYKITDSLITAYNQRTLGLEEDYEDIRCIRFSPEGLMYIGTNQRLYSINL